MTSLRQAMTFRRARALRTALATLAAVLRHDDDPHAVRITIATADGEHDFGSLCLGVLPLTELVDAVHARSSEIARQPTAAQPTAPVLRVIPTDSFPATTDETRTP